MAAKIEVSDIEFFNFFYNSKLLGLRGVKEYRNLSVDQFELGNDQTGSYILFKGRANKTFYGKVNSNQWNLSAKILKHYLQNPVLFKIYEQQHDAGTYCCRLHNGNQRHQAIFSSRTSVSVIPPMQERDIILYDVRPFRDGQENRESTDTSAKKVMPESPRFEARTKVALLIGNADYLADKPLLDVLLADVRSMKSTFEDLGFRVFSYLDLTKTEMKSTIDWFIDVVKKVGKDVNSNEKSIRQFAKSQAFDSLNEPATNGNTVVLYSTSRGMSAYQNNQNGLLAKFFNQRIKQKTDVTSVMQNVLEDMFRYVAPPSSREVFVPGANIKLYIECQADTLNMIIYINTRTLKECDTIALDDIDIVVETFSPNFKIHSISMVSGRGKFEIKNIQKLRVGMIS
ncbi:MALT1 [Mytilus coruscus]|uniref:MALT1 n=1 Tax=Mytilus coruscus TaxID=42192 RepID=A0A6J8A9Q1_MYTCO|nr:MALT1 [Mytilus coruscus]